VAGAPQQLIGVLAEGRVIWGCDCFWPSKRRMPEKLLSVVVILCLVVLVCNRLWACSSLFPGFLFFSLWDFLCCKLFAGLSFNGRTGARPYYSKKKKTARLPCWPCDVAAHTAGAHVASHRRPRRRRVTPRSTSSDNGSSSGNPMSTGGLQRAADTVAGRHSGGNRGPWRPAVSQWPWSEFLVHDMSREARGHQSDNYWDQLILVKSFRIYTNYKMVIATGKWHSKFKQLKFHVAKSM
jgi:hypothetical protein